MTTIDGMQNTLQKDSCMDCLILDALEIAVQEGEVSVTVLQRRLRIGYARAGRIVDLLEKHGFIGPLEGPQPRKCLLVRMPDTQPEMPAEPSEACIRLLEGLKQDGLLLKAAAIAAEMQTLGVSRLQRSLAIGYARAARVIYLLEACGVVKRREDVGQYESLLTRDEFDMLRRETEANLCRNGE